VIEDKEEEFLRQVVFDTVVLRWDRPHVDLFATSLNHKLETFVSPVPDPLDWINIPSTTPITEDCPLGFMHDPCRLSDRLRDVRGCSFRKAFQQLADFLVYLFEIKRLVPSTIKGYRSAIGRTISLLGGPDFGQNEYISLLVRSFSLERPKQNKLEDLFLLKRRQESETEKA
jgi:hypothetical protein